MTRRSLILNSQKARPLNTWIKMCKLLENCKSQSFWRSLDYQEMMEIMIQTLQSKTKIYIMSSSFDMCTKQFKTTTTLWVPTFGPGQEKAGLQDLEDPGQLVTHL